MILKSKALLTKAMKQDRIDALNAQARADEAKKNAQFVLTAAGQYEAKIVIELEEIFGRKVLPRKNDSIRYASRFSGSAYGTDVNDLISFTRAWKESGYTTTFEDQIFVLTTIDLDDTINFELSFKLTFTYAGKEYKISLVNHTSMNIDNLIVSKIKKFFYEEQSGSFAPVGLMDRT
jgi:hypothetical protein